VFKAEWIELLSASFQKFLSAAIWSSVHLVWFF